MWRFLSLGMLVPTVVAAAGCSASSSENDAAQASEAADTIGPTNECKVLDAYWHQQVGCTASGCKTYDVYGSDQLGCTATECKTYGVYSSYDQLGCTDAECKTYRVYTNQQLGCPRHSARGYVAAKSQP